MKEACGRTDHCNPEGTRSWGENCRVVSDARDQRSNVYAGKSQILEAERLKGRAVAGAANGPCENAVRSVKRPMSSGVAALYHCCWCEFWRLAIAA
jgi:hypothetical protein